MVCKIQEISRRLGTKWGQLENQHLECPFVLLYNLSKCRIC